MHVLQDLLSLILLVIAPFSYLTTSAHRRAHLTASTFNRPFIPRFFFIFFVFVNFLFWQNTSVFIDLDGYMTISFLPYIMQH